MKLCDIEPGPDVTAVPVGYDQGTQLDTYRAEADLCPECAGALLGGRWDLIHERYTSEGEVRRG